MQLSEHTLSLSDSRELLNCNYRFALQIKLFISDMIYEKYQCFYTVAKNLSWTGLNMTDLSMV